MQTPASIKTLKTTFVYEKLILLVRHKSYDTKLNGFGIVYFFYVYTMPVVLATSTL
jgi:hypothetical protein